MRTSYAAFTALVFALAAPAFADEPAGEAVAIPAGIRLDFLGDPLPRGAVLRLGTERFRLPPNSSGYIHGVDWIGFTPDGEQVIASGGTKVFFFDRRSGVIVRTIDVDAENSRVGLSADGSLLAAGDAVWDVKTGKMLARLSTRTSSKDSRQRMYISHDGRIVVMVRPDEVVVWNTADKAEQARIVRGKCSRNLVAVSRDCSQLAFLGEEQDHDCDCVWVWKTTAGAEPKGILLQDKKDLGPFPGIRSIAFHPNGTELAAAYSDGPIRIWDLATGACKQTVDDGSDYVEHLCYSADGNLLAYTAYSSVGLWDMQEGKLRWRRKAPYHVQAIAFSPDDRLIATGSENRDGRIRMWDTATGDLLWVIPGPWNVREVRWLTDGTLRVWGDQNSVWDVGTGKQVKSDGENWSPPDTKASLAKCIALATGSQDDPLSPWYARSTIRTMPILQRPVWKRCDSTCSLFDSLANVELLRFEDHNHWLIFSPDNTRLVTLNGGVATVWSLRPEECATVAPPLDNAKLELLWDMLHADDPAEAYDAICSLQVAGNEGVPFLAGKLTECERDERFLRSCTANLDHPSWDVRKAAVEALAKMGFAAKPILEHASENGSSDASFLAQVLLVRLRGKPDVLNRQRLQRARAMLALRRIATPAAREALEAVVRQAPLTTEAATAEGILSGW